MRTVEWSTYIAAGWPGINFNSAFSFSVSGGDRSYLVMAQTKPDMFGTYENLAATARRYAAFRAWLCSLLGCPYDSCYTIGELIRDARAAGLYGWEVR